MQPRREPGFYIVRLAKCCHGYTHPCNGHPWSPGEDACGDGWTIGEYDPDDEESPDSYPWQIIGYDGILQEHEVEMYDGTAGYPGKIPMPGRKLSADNSRK